jgi:hypothetical protein
MSSEHSTTPAVALQTVPAFVVATDLAANVAIAQHAGDLAYAFAERAGATLPERAIAYHVAFAETMRELSNPLPCPCDLCSGGEVL